MTTIQVYDNVTGRGMPARMAAQTAVAEPTIQPDPGVAQLAELQACVAAQPDNLQCTVGLASFYYQLKQWPQAQVTYEQAVRLDPHDPTLLFKLAGTYIYQEDFAKAVPALQQASSVKPDAPEIHLLLGLSLSKLDPPQIDNAVAEWRKVIAIDPKSEWASQAQQYISEAGK